MRSNPRAARGGAMLQPALTRDRVWISRALDKVSERLPSDVHRNLEISCGGAILVAPQPSQTSIYATRPSQLRYASRGVAQHAMRSTWKESEVKLMVERCDVMDMFFQLTPARRTAALFHRPLYASIGLYSFLTPYLQIPRMDLAVQHSCPRALRPPVRRNRAAKHLVARRLTWMRRSSVDASMLSTSTSPVGVSSHARDRMQQAFRRVSDGGLANLEQ
eukprot:1612942-Amphidinium_carterae.2